MSKREKAARYVLHAVTILYGLACLWLFYHQSIAELSLQGETPYQSDLPLHISMVVEDGWNYSLTGYIYKFLYSLCGGTAGIAVFLALVATATVYATEGLVCYLGGYEKRTWYSLMTALSLNFVMPIYIRAVGEFRYVSYQSANIWHNSTYLCMRLAALITLLLYFRLEKKYRTGICWKEWGLFALLNIICTAVKPSFLVAFSPVMGIFLLIDLFRGVPLKRILVFGSALLPSGGVLLLQNAVLFGDDTGNGMAFRPWYTFSMHTAIPKLAVVCSALFCGVILLLTLKQLASDRDYLFIVVMTILGFLEALCIVENGSRSADGNFLWGYSFCLFVFFTACVVKWCGMERKGVRGALRIVAGLLYGWHLYCGLYFFINLVSGVGFWMR